MNLRYDVNEKSRYEVELELAAVGLTLASPTRLDCCLCLLGAHIFTQWSSPEVAIRGRVG